MGPPPHAHRGWPKMNISYSHGKCLTRVDSSVVSSNNDHETHKRIIEVAVAHAVTPGSTSGVTSAGAATYELNSCFSLSCSLSSFLTSSSSCSASVVSVLMSL